MFKQIWGRLRDTFRPAPQPNITIPRTSEIQPKLELPQRVVRNLQIQMAMKAFAGLSQQQAYEIVRKRIKRRHNKRARGRIKL